MNEKDLVTEYYDSTITGFTDVWKVALDSFWIIATFTVGIWTGLLASAGNVSAKLVTALMPTVMLLFAFGLMLGMIFRAQVEKRKTLALSKLGVGGYYGHKKV